MRLGEPKSIHLWCQPVPRPFLADENRNLRSKPLGRGILRLICARILRMTVKLCRTAVQAYPDFWENQDPRFGQTLVTRKVNVDFGGRRWRFRKQTPLTAHRASQKAFVMEIVKLRPRSQCPILVKLLSLPHAGTLKVTTASLSLIGPCCRIPGVKVGPQRGHRMCSKSILTAALPDLSDIPSCPWPVITNLQV